MAAPRPVHIGIVLAASLATGCLGPPNPMLRLGDVAYEMNAATRFGRMDVAIAHVATEGQQLFATRHASWGEEVRVLDVELASVRLVDDETAEVVVVVQWHHIDETNIRTTRLAQRYEQGGNDWQLVEERRIAGARGLFHATPKAKEASDLADGAGGADGEDR